MPNYESVLRHIGEPQRPSERNDTVSVLCDDYESLWFAKQLEEYAGYGVEGGTTEESIVLGYSEYIDQKVRVEKKSTVRLYVHTSMAASVLIDALHHNKGTIENTEIADTLEDAFSDVLVHFAVGGE